MARGKYSPTVQAAYSQDKEWHAKFAQGEQYDPEGFDSYGYDRDDIDRAGNNEFDYLANDGDWDAGEDYNTAFNSALDEWGFDGQKPCLR